jgi:CPA2 family monovalent cation:H+ antiporter-2
MAGIDPIVTATAIIALVIVIVTILLKLLDMPSVVGYILAGVLLGSYGFNLINNVDVITQLGSIGVLLLLFFIGMEVDINKIISNWRIAIFGVLIKIFVTLLIMFGLSYYFVNWGIEQIILISFVLSISSTAVVLKILQDKNEMETNVGANVVSILLVQDVVVIPMIVILNLFSPEPLSSIALSLQILGGFLFVATLIYILKKKQIKLPFGKYINKDTEIQFFIALLFCFGFAIVSELFYLSGTLGAFLAGLLVSAGKETHWFKENLHPFYVLFMAFFFLSIGLLIDINFLIENIKIISFLVLFTFIVNTIIYHFIFRLFKRGPKASLYGASLLSQVGEFSFILAAVGLANGMIQNYSYQISISVISLSLLFSPLWIGLIKWFIGFDKIKLTSLKIPGAAKKLKNKLRLTKKKKIVES